MLKEAWGRQVYLKVLQTQFFSLYLCNLIKRAHISGAGASLVVQTAKHICLQCRAPSFDPWVGKTPPLEKGTAAHCSIPENFTDRGGWWVTVHRVAESLTQLSD